MIWQGVDPVEFIRAFPDRIYHVHMKDAIVTLNGRSGILGSHLNFGDPRRGWEFRSLGRGGVNFEEIIRALNAVGYTGPLSVEWEDCGMDREHGAKEACEFVKKLDFEPSGCIPDSCRHQICSPRTPVASAETALRSVNFVAKRDDSTGGRGPSRTRDSCRSSCRAAGPSAPRLAGRLALLLHLWLRRDRAKK